MFGVRVTHMSGVCNLGPQGGFKGQLSSLKSLFNFFLPKDLFVLTNKRNGIFIMSPWPYPGDGTRSCLGSKFYFF